MERNCEDRVDRVVSQLLKKHYNSIVTEETDGLTADVKKVLTVLPSANPNEVFALLEERENVENRIDEVVLYLQSRTVTRLGRTDTLPDDPALRNDPLYRDMRIIAKVVPDADPNEIYAFLEAHRDRKNRIKYVIEEFLRILPSSQTSSLGDYIFDSQDHEPENNRPKIAYNIQDEIDELREIFPDCDPGYLYNELEKRQDDKERVRNLAMSMFEDESYPKYKDVLKEKEKKQIEERIENLKFKLSDFMAKFPDPVETFEKFDKNMSINYREHAAVQIRNDFKEVKAGYLRFIMTKYNFHYVPSYKAIKKLVQELPEDSQKIKSEPRTKQEPFPTDPDEFFFYEKLYLVHEEEIKEHVEELKRLTNLRRQQAKENGEFVECGCCYDNECLVEEVSTCEDGHIFCKDCIRRSTEIIMGQNQCEFPCFSEDCEYKIPLSVLQTVIPSKMFSVLLRRLQEEEIKKADIPDLVNCPFCSFATIITNPDDKVFKCLNPDCLKDSCRLCKEPNHLPLSCNEIEKQGQTNMRTYIETCVSESMLRQCQNCFQRFFKVYGCNMMTCTCGFSMCYICRKPGIEYSHFDDTDCEMYTDDIKEKHAEEMRKALYAASDKYIAEHPNAKDVDPDYDKDEHLNHLLNIYYGEKKTDGSNSDDEGDESEDDGGDEDPDSDDNWFDDDDDENILYENVREQNVEEEATCDEQAENENSTDEKAENEIITDEKSENKKTTDDKAENEITTDKKSGNEKTTNEKAENEIKNAEKSENEKTTDEKAENEKTTDTETDSKTENEITMDEKSENELKNYEKSGNEKTTDEKAEN